MLLPVAISCSDDVLIIDCRPFRTPEVSAMRASMLFVTRTLLLAPYVVSAISTDSLHGTIASAIPRFHVSHVQVHDSMQQRKDTVLSTSELQSKCKLQSHRICSMLSRTNRVAYTILPLSRATHWRLCHLLELHLLLHSNALQQLPVERSVHSHSSVRDKLPEFKSHNNRSALQ